MTRHYVGEKKPIKDETDTWKDTYIYIKKTYTAEYVIMKLEEERLFRLVAPFCLGF